MIADIAILIKMQVLLVIMNKQKNRSLGKYSIAIFIKIDYNVYCTLRMPLKNIGHSIRRNF